MMSPAERDLSGVRLKLARASGHIEAIRAKIEAFVERTPPPFSFRSERRSLKDGSGGDEYTLYAIVHDQPPRDFAPMIGDALHNIRSALDHLVYELAPANVRDTVRTQFPIFTEEATYQKKAEPMIRGVEGKERALIERVQPWRSDEPDAHPLAVLNRLSNLDKHRLLVPVIASVDPRNVWVGSSNADVKFTHIEFGAVSDGDRIVEFTARPTGGVMAITPQSGLHVALDPSDADARVPWNRPVDDLLEVLRHYVEQSVIDRWFKYGWLPPERSAD